MYAYPPAMSLLNHWKGDVPGHQSSQRTSSNFSRTNLSVRRNEDRARQDVDLVKELRERRDQLEELIKKTGIRYFIFFILFK